VHTTIVLHDRFGALPYSHSTPTGEHAPPDGGDAGHTGEPPPLLEPLDPPELDAPELELLLLDELPPLDDPPLLDELPPEELPLDDDAPLLPPLEPELEPAPPSAPAPPSFPPTSVAPPHAASATTTAITTSLDLMSRPLPPHR
jgi:hypothetical protein